MTANKRQSDEQFMRRYLRDVYGTEDIEELHGGMPEHWQVWLNSEVGKRAWLLCVLLTIR